VAGVSTGALIAPFAFLGRDEIAEAARWYDFNPAQMHGMYRRGYLEGREAVSLAGI